MLNQVQHDGESRLGGPRSWYVLILLTLVAAVSLLDRQVITILAVDIKRDLGLNDSEIGLIYGTFFAVFYALFSIPLGRLADGWVRTRQVGLSLVGWCGATIACAFATGFGSLALFRAGVAIGEAGSGPAAYSMVSDLFPRGQRATAMAVYGTSAALGTGMSIALGGIVVDAWNHAFPGGHGWFGLVGWQAAFIIAALPGFVLALLIVLVREPVRGVADGIVQPGVPNPFGRAAREFGALIPIVSVINLQRMGAPRADMRRNLLALIGVLLFITVATIASHAITPPVRLKVYTTIAGIRVTSHLIQWAVVGFGSYAAFSWIQSQRLRDAPAFRVMWSSPAFIAMLVVGAFNLMVNYGYTAWVGPYAVQHYGASLSEVGSKIGLSAMVSGGAGTIFGGLLGDRLRRVSRRGRLWVLVLATVTPLPMAFVTFAQATLDGFVLWFLLASMILTGWLPCAMATLHDLVLPRMRGTATAIFYLGVTIFGMGTGPYLVGLISDSTGSLGRGILTVYAASGIVWVAIAVAFRHLVRDEDSLLARARAAGEPI